MKFWTTLLAISLALALPAHADDHDDTQALKQIIAIQQAQIASQSQQLNELEQLVRSVISADGKWTGDMAGLRGEKGDKGDKGDRGHTGKSPCGKVAFLRSHGGSGAFLSARENNNVETSKNRDTWEKWKIICN